MEIWIGMRRKNAAVNRQLEDLYLDIQSFEASFPFQIGTWWLIYNLVLGRSGDHKYRLVYGLGKALVGKISSFLVSL